MLDQSETAADAPAKALWMRQLELDDVSGHGTRVVRVLARSCAIGSDDSCNLRVATKGACPVQCLILRGSQHIAIRRLSPDALLNGHEFSEAVLSVGDRVTAGTCEFEILDADGATSLATVEHLLELFDEPGAALRQTALEQWQSSERLREAVELNRARVRRLLRYIRSLEPKQDEKVETRDTRCQDAESDGHVAEAGSQDAAKQTSDEQIPASLNQPPAESPLPVHASAVTPSAGRGAPLTAVAGEEDESIDACIARFMRRISGPQARVETPYVPPGTPVGPASQRIDRPADSGDQKKAGGLEAAALLTTGAPRPSAPPVPANLSAMRELAHEQARSALDVHFRRTLLRTSIEQVLVIVGSLAGGLFCLLLSSHAPLALFPAMVGFAVAIVWSARCAPALVQLVGERRRTKLVVEPKRDV
jgi:hypothetical protein